VGGRGEGGGGTEKKTRSVKLNRRLGSGEKKGQLQKQGESRRKKGSSERERATEKGVDGQKVIYEEVSGPGGQRGDNQKTNSREKSSQK